MKIKLHYIGLLLLIISCHKSETVQPAKEEESIPVKLDFSVKQLPIHSAKGYESYNFVGYGYDLTGRYANVNAVRAAVINTPDMVKNHPDRLENSRIVESSFSSIYASDPANLVKELTDHLNPYPSQNLNYFAGTITEIFPGTNPRSKNYIYGLYDLYTKFRRLTLTVNKPLLTKYLTDDFKLDSEQLSAKDLVKKYGTHILLSLYTGGKLSIYYQAKYAGTDAQKAAENSFRLGLTQGFGLFSGFLDPIDSTTLQGISTPNMAFEVAGGDTTLVSRNKIGIYPMVNFKDWSKSFTEKNSQFIYLDDMSKLCPIYEMIANADKREEVRQFIDAYLASSDININ